MERMHLTEALFRERRGSFGNCRGFAQNAEALVRLVVQADGPVCNIATAPLSLEDRRRFLSELNRRNWSVQIDATQWIEIGGTVYDFEIYMVKLHDYRAKRAYAVTT